MSDFVKYSDQKNLLGQDKVSILPKEKRYIMIADEETGKIKGCFPLKNKNLGTGWIALYQNPAAWLAQQRLTGEQYSVMLFLFSKLDFDNYLHVSRADIAEALNLQPTHVSRAMRVLKDLEIIIEGPSEGKFKTYRLNPYVAHKGTNRENTIMDFDTARKNYSDGENGNGKGDTK